MSTDIAKQKLFAELVERATAASRQIISLLETEFDTLCSNKPDSLVAVTAQKKQYLLQLSQTMAEQEALLASMNLPNNAEGVKQLYRGLPAGHPWVASWMKLRKLAKTLAENNLRNGILLTQQTNHTRNALDILTGHKSSPATYQYGGRTESTRQCKSLAYA